MGALSYNVISSSSYKKDIIKFKDAISLLKTTPIFSFNYKWDEATRYGIIANDSDRRLVTTDRGKADISSILALSVGALQELAQLTNLKEAHSC
jgi:hypothetical protein